jgi:NAD(P)-dependent dehydrogenase (short-subunit alcohol dehydrogenase family)
MTSNQRVAVVTGSSTGNGYETSLTLARNGFLTYATMRNLNKGENIKSLAEKEILPLKTVQLDDGIALNYHDILAIHCGDLAALRLVGLLKCLSNISLLDHE